MPSVRTSTNLALVPLTRVASNLLRVSKKWRSYLISNSCLWRDLDLSLTRRPVSRNCIANYIKWSDGRMHTARLKRLAKFQSLWELGRQCQITSLCWMGSDFTLASITHPLMAFKNLQSLTVTCEFVTLDSVQVILRQVPSLISLEFHYLHDVKQHLLWDFDLPNLQHLKINCAKKFNNDWFLKLCPVSTLALPDFSAWLMERAATTRQEDTEHPHFGADQLHLRYRRRRLLRTCPFRDSRSRGHLFWLAHTQAPRRSTKSPFVRSKFSISPRDPTSLSQVGVVRLGCKCSPRCTRSLHPIPQS